MMINDEALNGSDVLNLHLYQKPTTFSTNNYREHNTWLYCDNDKAMYKVKFD